MSAISSEVRLEQLTADATRCGSLALFNRLIAEGKTPEAAAMYACQQAPGTKNTDRAFCQGQQRKMNGMSPLVGGMLQRAAKKAGIQTAGKYYMSGLGKATDKHAWVSSAEDVLTVAKQRNLNIEGVVNHKAVKREDKEQVSVPLAPDVIRQIEKKMLRADPGLLERVKNNKHARRELHEAIVDKHARKKRYKKSNRLLK